MLDVEKRSHMILETPDRPGKNAPLKLAKPASGFERNNLDCLRLVLASTVAFFHLSVLTGMPELSFLERYLSPHFAVRGFFVISGLLIYRSYVRSPSLRSYFEKRMRRIYPGYAFTVLASAILLYLLSDMPTLTYFGWGFQRYLGANLLFLNFLAPTLPDVFRLNLQPEINGALWTLKIEVAFYLLVPFIHMLGIKFGLKKTIGCLFLISCLWRYGFAFLNARYLLEHPSLRSSGRSIFEQLQVQFPGQLIYFSAGLLILIYLDAIKQNLIYVATGTLVLFATDHFVTGDLFDVAWISGVVIVAGFGHYLGNFSKHGDLSYGVYIVHWPIIQVLIATGVGRLPWWLFLFSAICAIGLVAWGLWHLVEKRFLTGSSHYCSRQHITIATRTPYPEAAELPTRT